MRNPAGVVGKVVLIVTSLTAAAAATAGAAAATPAVVDRSAKLRSGPGPGYPILATLPRGSSVDVRGCRSGWCEISWSGGRGYVALNLLAPTGVVPVVTLTPGPVYDDGYDYPGFDFPGTAYAPTFATVGPRWSQRRWSRLRQRPSFWRMPPPQIGATPPRLIGRTGMPGPAAGVESQFGARPTVGSTFSDPPVPAARASPAAAPDSTPTAAAETPGERR